jgi:4-amino-4-deoxy-L-arabinose transferase-like glycosyltransferase
VNGGPPAGLALLAALTVLRLWVAARMPLSPDEAYYWVWSRALAAGYLDHPPMVALWVRAGAALLGQSALGVRLLAPLSAALGTLLLADAARVLLPAARGAGLRAGALLNATLLFGAGAVTMTPDTPLLFFWTAMLWAMARLVAGGAGGWWLLAGLAGGLAMTSKYTALLAFIGVGLWLLVVPAARPWLRRWQPWAGLALALLAFAPVLAWNAAHGFASFVKQGGRTGVWQPAAALHHLGELLAGQAGLATPLIFVLCLAGLVVVGRRGGRGEPAAALLLAFSLPVALVFVEHALGDRVQANWPAILYPAGAIAAAAITDAGCAAPFWRRLLPPALALGLAMTAIVYAQAAFAPLALPPRLDPTLRQLGGWPMLARQVAADDPAFVVVENYGVAAELAWLLPPEMIVIGTGPRWAYLALPDARASIAGRRGLFVSTGDTPPASGWEPAIPRGIVARRRNGVLAATYRLYDVEATGAAAVLLPRPH